MGITRRIRPLAFTALCALLAACQPSTGPDLGVTFDSEATLSAYASMDSVLASPILGSLVALSGRTPLTTPSPVGGRSGGPAAAPIISDLHRGATFVYDPHADEYVRDPSRTDGPETGVRFVLYEVDFLGDPIVEEEIGHADLIDEGDESAEDIVLHLVVVGYETTVLDYRIALDILTNGGTLGAHGSLQEPGGPRLDFDIDATSTHVGEGAKTLDVAFDLRVEARDFSVTGAVSGVEGDIEGNGTVELTVRHGDDSIRLSVEGDNGRLDGSVFVNGSLFATVTGDADSPVILSASGEPLDLRERLVLHRIIDGAEDVFDFLEDLIDPVDELIILAIIL